MKKVILFCFINLFLIKLIIAQDPTLTNPIVTGPMNLPIINTDVNATKICVSFYNNSLGAIPFNPDPLFKAQIIINTDQLTFDPGAIVVAPDVPWFDWTILCENNCGNPQLATYFITGIQNSIIPGRPAGDPGEEVPNPGGSICINGTAAPTPISTPTSGVGFNANVTSFYDIFPNTTSNQQATYTITSTVPITIIDFKVRKEGEISLLQWKTAQADNFSHFEVERAGVDGNFVNIGQVNYPALDDRSNEKDFSFVDPTPLDGDNYYRLKLIDLDNSFEFSDIKTINFNAASLEVFPNPVAKGNSLQVKTNKVLGKIQIVDANGKLVRQVNHSGGELNIQTENMVTGMYYIKQGDSKELLPFIVVE